MQTFITSENISETAKILDTQRLGKQRVEAVQIANILLDQTDSKGWRNHPAVKNRARAKIKESLPIRMQVKERALVKDSPGKPGQPEILHRVYPAQFLQHPGMLTKSL